MKTANIAFIHTSAAAILPLSKYYASAEPGWTVTNLLDDGILRLFRAGDEAGVETALLRMVERAVNAYGCTAGMITCSSVSLAMLGRLNQVASIPLVKIDAPMAMRAVQDGGCIGLLYTFPPTLGPTRQLLSESAEAIGIQPGITPLYCEDAFDALLAGDTITHNRLLLESGRTLHSQGVERIVLAQVSMAQMRAPLEDALGIPVYSSLETSHSALKEIVGP